MLSMCRPYRPPGTANYCVRLTVPKHLRDAVGKTALKRSLKTPDPAEARRKAPAMCAELHRIIDEAKTGHAFGYEDVQAIAAQYRAERTRHVLDSATRNAWSDTDFDSRQDHLQDVVDDERDLHGDSSAEVRAAATVWGKPALDRFLADHPQSLPGEWRSATAEAIYLAERHALAGARHERLKDVPPPPKPAVSASPRPRSIAKLFRQYADAQDLSPRTRAHWQKLVEHFEHWLDGKPAHAVRKPDLFKYADHLRKVGGTGKRPLSTKTINEGYLAAIKQAFRFAHARGWLAANPAQGVSLQPTRAETHADDVRPYTDAEVAILLAATRRQKLAYQRWCPWLAAFTGARISELLNASKADVIEDHGIHYLYIRPKAGGTLKTADSRRRVPLHQGLIDEGFLDYVATVPNDGYLFPGEWSDANGDRTKTPANRLRDMLNKAMPDHEGRVAPNHSFRHWLSSALRRCNVSDDLSRELAGHAPRDVHARYGRGDLASLNAGIQSLPSPMTDRPTGAMGKLASHRR